MIKSPGKRIYFDSVYADKYGIREAILINYFQFYISANLKILLAGKKKESNTTFRDGRTYTFISKSDLEQYYPFFTESMLKTSLNNLVEEGVLVKGCYNKLKYDKTTWYAFTNEEEFFELPDEYIQKKRGHHLVKSVSDHNTGPYQCSAIPPDDTLDNVDQGSLGTGSEQTTEEVLLTNSSEVKPQPIGQKSPTLPVNTNIDLNIDENNTYLPYWNDVDQLNSDLQSIEQSVEESELDDELRAWKEPAYNGPVSKVSKSENKAADGSRQNADDYCSVTDEEKLKTIFIRYHEKTGESLEYVVQWHNWVCKQQKDVSEIKHASAWIKSYQTFATKNSVYEEARKQESLRKKKEDELARRPVLNKNPYNDMLKPGYENSRKGNTDSK